MKSIESVMEKLNLQNTTIEDLHQQLPFVDQPAKSETLPPAPVEEVKPAVKETVTELNVISLSSTCKNCDNTQSWGSSRYCPECGFYPPTGQTFPGFVKADEVQEEIELKKWYQLIPQWAWITGGVSILIILASIIIGINLKGSPMAKTWGITQFALATCGILLAHVLAYTYSLHKTDEFGVVSLMMKPFKMWQWVYRSLPDSQSEFNCAIWCITAMICAPLFISQINFNDITSFYAMRKSSDKNLAAAVQEKVAQGEADGDLEGAMNSFSDKAASNVTGMAGGDSKTGKNPAALNNVENPAETQLLETDCVVIGFSIDELHNPTQLVLASTVNGSLQYVGTVTTEELKPEDIDSFKRRAASLFRPRPLIPAPVDAFWLKPVITVRILHKDWTPSRKLIEPKIGELLADLTPEVPTKGKNKTPSVNLQKQ